MVSQSPLEAKRSDFQPVHEEVRTKSSNRHTGAAPMKGNKPTNITGKHTFSINQSIKIYTAPLQDPYSEALPTQAKRKKWEQAPFGRCLRSIGRPFQVVGPTTEKERVCIVAEQANGTTKLPWTEDRSVRRPAQEERGQQSWYNSSFSILYHSIHWFMGSAPIGVQCPLTSSLGEFLGYWLPLQVQG